MAELSKEELECVRDNAKAPSYWWAYTAVHDLLDTRDAKDAEIAALREERDRLAAQVELYREAWTQLRAELAKAPQREVFQDQIVEQMDELMAAIRARAEEPR